MRANDIPATPPAPQRPALSAASQEAVANVHLFARLIVLRDRKGFEGPEEHTCPVEGCECEAVEVLILSAALFGGTFGRALRDVPPRRWLWPHHAVGLPATAYRIVGR